MWFLERAYERAYEWELERELEKDQAKNPEYRLKRELKRKHIKESYNNNNLLIFTAKDPQMRQG